MRRYVISVLGLLLVLLAGTLGIGSAGIDQCTLLDRNICGLVHFQEAKLAAAPEQIDILFLGDSSLGNAIDARQVAALSGRTTLSLALSGGALGLPAIYTQLRNAVETRKIVNLVLMVSPEDYRRGFGASADGFVLANAGTLGRIFELPPRHAVIALGSLVRFLFDDGVVTDGWRGLTSGTRDLGDCDGCAQRDYVAQEPGGGLTPNDLKKWKGPSNDFDPFLKKIAALCTKHEINCLYSHGPLVQAILDLNPGYVATIDGKIDAAGIRFVSREPIIIPPDEVGDSPNHVRPDLRPAYTGRIYRDLAPLLK